MLDNNITYSHKGITARMTGCSRQKEERTTYELPELTSLGAEERDRTSSKTSSKRGKGRWRVEAGRELALMECEGKPGSLGGKNTAGRQEERPGRAGVCVRCFKETDMGQYKQSGIWVTEMRLDKQVLDHVGPWGIGMDT